MNSASTPERSREALAKAERLAEFRRQKEEGLAEKQAARRLEVQQAEQQLFTRQQAERLALHAAQKSESRGFLFRVRSAVADLIRRTPGLRSVLSHIQKMTHLDPKERHRLENEALARRHAREKRDIERRRRTLARLETRERQSLEKAVQARTAAPGGGAAGGGTGRRANRKPQLARGRSSAGVRYRSGL